jgi:hypothetical protein
MALYIERPLDDIFEGYELKPEFVDVLSCVRVCVKNSDRSHLGVASILESVSRGKHAAARTILGFQHCDVIAVLHQVVSGSQPRKAGAEDNHTLPASSMRDSGIPGGFER